MSTNSGIGEDQILEALKLAKLNISTFDELPWEFANWQTCTCGHIYKASGHHDQNISNICSPRSVDGLYEAVMIAVARANCGYDFAEDIQGRGRGLTLASAISNATTLAGLRTTGKTEIEYEEHSDFEEHQRQAALVLIDNTIAMIEAEHEEARQEILEVAKSATPTDLVAV